MALKTIHYKSTTLDISYELLYQDRKEVILFLHGWGANKAMMRQAFGEYFEGYCHLYMDLSGFGGSSIQNPLNSCEYREIVEIFLDALHVKPFMIVGHSFGGKIATLLNPQNLVLLSSAGIVPSKSLHVKVKIALFKLLKSYGLGALYKVFASKDVEGMSKIMYETLKNVVDEKMDDEFANFKGRALIFWGEDDTATPLKSGKMIHKLIKNSSFYPLKGDHFFFLAHGKLIASKISQELGGEGC